MPSFTPSLLRRFFALLVVAFALAASAWAANGERIDALQASLDARDDGWVVNAEFALPLKPRMEEALERGVPLYFIVDFELTRPRWYWFDDKAATASQTHRLSYHALTREYRVSTGSLQLGFSSLDEALGFMARVHNWHVLDRNVIRPGETYVVGVRMQLDTSQLPKPFQMASITSREWTLESDWKRFTFEVPR